MKISGFLYTVILTATVFAAFITSIANIIISIINSYRLKQIEVQKKINEIDKYRYSRLYELIINWHKYDSEIKGETVSKMASYRLVHLFLDDLGRYEIVKPLLDECYTEKLEPLKIKCENLLKDLIDVTAPESSCTKNPEIIKEKYFFNGKEFSKLLKNSINDQLESLLRKNNLESSF
mgnify:CR=1 FL=1